MNTIKQLSISCSLTALALMSFYDKKAMSIFHYCSWLIASLGLLTMIILMVSKKTRDNVYKEKENKSKLVSFTNRTLRMFNIFITIWFGWYVLSTVYLAVCLFGKIVKDIRNDEEQ